MSSNNPMDYFRQFEQMGEQIKNMFGPDFMKNVMSNMPNMSGGAPGVSNAHVPNTSPFDWFQTQNRQHHLPVDLYQTFSELVAVIDIPGIEKKTGIIVSVEPDRLYIKGIPDNRHLHVPREQFLMTERNHGPIERQIQLPVRVLPNKIKASYKQGILEIRMTKDERQTSEPLGSAVNVDF